MMFFLAPRDMSEVTVVLHLPYPLQTHVKVLYILVVQKCMIGDV